MKISIATAALLALTSLSSGKAASPSLRSSMEQQQEEAQVFFKTSDKFIDASGTFVTEQDLTKSSKVVTPIYESTSTFYGGSESDAVENLDASVGASRAGYYKFRVADFMSDKATAIDIADFDNAWHEAFNMIHGTRDGIYFAGESIFKIEDEPEDKEDGMLQKKWTWKDWYVYMQYRCRWCPDDDSAEDTLLSFGRKDPVFNNKSMNAVAKKACEIMINMGNEHFTSVHDCTAVVSSPPDFAKLFDDKDVQDEILAASA